MRVLEQRFGLGDGYSRTLEEAGRQLEGFLVATDMKLS